MLTVDLGTLASPVDALLVQAAVFCSFQRVRPLKVDGMLGDSSALGGRDSGHNCVDTEHVQRPWTDVT